MAAWRTARTGWKWWTLQISAATQGRPGRTRTWWRSGDPGCGSASRLSVISSPVCCIECCTGYMQSGPDAASQYYLSVKSGEKYFLPSGIKGTGLPRQCGRPVPLIPDGRGLDTLTHQWRYQCDHTPHLVSESHNILTLHLLMESHISDLTPPIWWVSHIS